MSGRPNEWLSPGPIIGMIGLSAAAVATYSSFDGRITASEVRAETVDKRLQRMEDKMDFLVGQMIEQRGGK